MNHCVVLIKPDGLKRGIVGDVINRFEKKGLQLVGLKMVSLTDTILEQWYIHHKDKPFFPSLKDYMKQTPIVAMIWCGVDTATVVRNLLGPTDGKKAMPGTIRGDYAMSIQYNLVHASESSAAAEKEEALIFKKDEIFTWKKPDLSYIYSEEETK